MTERYVDTLARLLTKKRYRHTTDELLLQQEIAEHLDVLGVRYEREVRLSGKDRIDFLCGSLDKTPGVRSSGIGIEVKVQGSRNAVAEQLLRYTESKRVSGLGVFTTRALRYRVSMERLSGIHPVIQWLTTRMSPQYMPYATCVQFAPCQRPARNQVIMSDR